MRLIDADELLRDLSDILGERLHGNRKVRYGEVYGIIDNQPTAYDVDEVVRVLRKESWCIEDEDCNVCWEIDSDKAVDIVKRGGVID